MMFDDINSLAFSASGSWMSLVDWPTDVPVKLPHGPGLYLRSNHMRMVIEKELFLVRLWSHGEAVPHKLEAEPHCLRIVAEDGSGAVEVVFDGNSTVRFRGSGVGLRLDAPGIDQGAYLTVAQQIDAGEWMINQRHACRRYQVSSLTGWGLLDADWDGQMANRAALEFAPGADDTFEVAIDEYWSTWHPPQQSTFDEALASREAEWSAFQQTFPTVPDEFEETADLARYLLWSCTVSPTGLVRRRGILMSCRYMDQIWSWDNCFNAASLAAAHPQRAEEQFLVVFDHIDEAGAFPDALNDGFVHYNFSKPPVQGTLARWMDRFSPDYWTPERRERYYEPVSRFTRWWLEHRRYADDPLAYYLHGNDSGWDNTTLMRDGAPLIMPDLNAFLVTQLDFLAEQAEALGKGDEAATWKAEADRMTEALLDRLWDGDQFIAWLVPKKRAVKGQSLVAFMPLLLGDRLPKEVQEKLVAQVSGYLTEWGPATEHPESTLYEDDGYWRGPIWAPSTHLLVQGLDACGEVELAREVATRFCRLCQKSLFAENFDAKTGAPLRDLGYTWTAASFLELARYVEG